MGTVLAVIFGLLAAMAVFSYLDDSRSACMMHALPLRREALFFTNYLSGLSFLLLPNAAIFGLTLAGEAVGNCLDLKALAIWLLVQSASCLFFYSFAVVAVEKQVEHRVHQRADEMCIRDRSWARRCLRRPRSTSWSPLW